MERAFGVLAFGPILEVFQKSPETPQNRVNLLTDGLLNYGRKVKENLGKPCFTSIHTPTYI